MSLLTRTTETFGLELTDLAATLAVGGRLVARVPLAPGVIADGEILRPAALGDVLAGLVAEHPLPRRGSVALLTPRLLSRVVTFPAAIEDGDLREAVRFQVRDVLPLPVDEAVLAHATIGVDGETRRVLVAAVEEDRLAALHEALATARIRRGRIVAGPTALVPALAGPDERVLVVHADALTSIAVAEDGACAFFRTVPVGVASARHRMLEQLGLDTDRVAQRLADAAEGRAATGEPDLAAAVDGLLAATVADVASEVAASLDYHLRGPGAGELRAVRLTGEAAGWPGLRERLEHDLGLPVEPVATPEAGLAVALSRHAAFAVAPIAVRRHRATGAPRSVRTPVALACIAALGAGAVGVAVAGNRVEQREADIAAADDRIAALDGVARELRPAGEVARRRAATEDAVRQVLDGRFDWSASLADLAAAAPSTIRLSAVRGTVDDAVARAAKDGGQARATLRGARTNPALELTGCATTNRAVSRFATRLAAMDGVTTVSVDRTTRGAARAVTCSGVQFTAVAFYERFDRPGSLSPAGTVPPPPVPPAGTSTTPTTPATTATPGTSAAAPSSGARR